MGMRNGGYRVICARIHGSFMNAEGFMDGRALIKG